MIHILKFGGTSVNSEAKLESIIKIVKEKRKQGVSPVLVVSAPGRAPEPYATDTLLGLISKNNDREIARCITCGEIISAAVIADRLQIKGVPALSVTHLQIGIYTDEKYLSSHIKTINPLIIKKLIEKGKVPVVAGFQGVNNFGEITTLGRGGSDFTAVALAVALKAEMVEIYKEHNGIFTADPTIVKASSQIKEMDFKELFELSSEGAKVVSKEAAQLANENMVSMFIKSYDKDSMGTHIHDFKPNRFITAITSKKNILFISIAVKDKFSDLDVFSYIASYGISADFIDIRDKKITFITDEIYNERLIEILDFYNFDYTISQMYVKISLVGAGMTGIPGVMAKIIQTLKSRDIELIQTTDSHTTISCLINAYDHDRAIEALHKEFLEK